MSESAGSRLGPYELVEKIGEGGMGEVWRARDTRLNRTVAIKRLRARYSERFEREARAIAALNHPNICTLHDVGPDYLVMEYVEGAPLAGPQPAAEAVRLALEIADALAEAHMKGILHRDLKPANVLVTPRGSVKLLDFGLAKTLAGDDDVTLAGTLAGTVVGTVAYMSPEQARGERLDARSDVFAFGAMLYELLSGRRAFGSGSAPDTLSAILRDEPPPIDVPPELDRIVRGCLRKARADRYASIGEIRAALGAVRLPAEPGPITEARPSIAVLPFANLSRNEEDEYFSDGLAEEIINALVKVPGLKVIARTSAFAFKGQHTDIRKIAETLGVTSVLEGSVRRSGNRIRVTAQLITAADGTHLWSERYDRQMEDVFEMQDEIATAIASALQPQFTPVPSPRPKHQPNLQAYEAYLRHLNHEFGLTAESLRRSRECLEQAITLDPGFALPHVGLADHHLALAATGLMPARDAMPRARELAERALGMDPELPEAFGMLGIVAGDYDRNWEAAERWFERAIVRDPVPWHLRTWYALLYLLPVGRADAARHETELALQDNPLGQVLHWERALMLEALGRDDEALAAHRRACELDPQFWTGWAYLGRHLALRGRYGDARDPAEKGATAPTPYAVGTLAGVLRVAGEDERAEELLEQVPVDRYGGSYARACASLLCGTADETVNWVIKAADDRQTGFIARLVRPQERRLRQAARWPDLLRKLNLPV